jgi:hypothetical protein
VKKIDIAIKLLKSPHAKKLVQSPQARRLAVKAWQNEKVRKAVIKQVTKRMFAR